MCARFCHFVSNLTFSTLRAQQPRRPGLAMLALRLKFFKMVVGFYLAHMWSLVTSLRLRARAGGAKRSPTSFVWCLRRGHKITNM